MKAFSVSCIVACLLLWGGVITLDARAEGSGPKVTNPYGRQPESRRSSAESRSSAEKREKRAPAVALSRLIHPFTPAGVKGNFQKFNKSTRNAWVKTRQTFSPKNVLPHFSDSDDGAKQEITLTERQQLKKKQRSEGKEKEVSRTSWLFSNKD